MFCLFKDAEVSSQSINPQRAVDCVAVSYNITHAGTCDLQIGEGNGNPFSILAWKIPWTEESDRLQSKRLQRVGPDSAHGQWPVVLGRYFTYIVSQWMKIILTERP